MATKTTIAQRVARIDRGFEPDPNAVIECEARTTDGHRIDVLICNLCNGAGPAVWPGHTYLGRYGAVPIIRSIHAI
jgi:hypothetical protein